MNETALYPCESVGYRLAEGYSDAKGDYVKCQTTTAAHKIPETHPTRAQAPSTPSAAPTSHVGEPRE